MVVVRISGANLWSLFYPYSFHVSGSLGSHNGQAQDTYHLHPSRFGHNLISTTSLASVSLTVKQVACLNWGDGEDRAASQVLGSS